MPGQLAPRRGLSKLRPGFWPDRGQLLGGGDVQDRACPSWSRDHSAGSAANSRFTWEASPSKTVSGSVTVIVMSASLTPGTLSACDVFSPVKESVDKPANPPTLGTLSRFPGGGALIQDHSANSGPATGLFTGGQPIQDCVRISSR